VRQGGGEIARTCDGLLGASRALVADAQLSADTSATALGVHARNWHGDLRASCIKLARVTHTAPGKKRLRRAPAIDASAFIRVPNGCMCVVSLNVRARRAHTDALTNQAP